MFESVATQSINTSFCFIITNQWSPNFIDLVAKIVKKDYKTLFPNTTSKKKWCGYAKTISIVVHCSHVHGHITIFIWHIKEKKGMRTHQHLHLQFSNLIIIIDPWWKTTIVQWIGHHWNNRSLVIYEFPSLTEAILLTVVDLWRADRQNTGVFVV